MLNKKNFAFNANVEISENMWSVLKKKGSEISWHCPFNKVQKFPSGHHLVDD